MRWLIFKLIELHLLEYHQWMLEYLTSFETQKVNVFQPPVSLQKFSSYDDPNGYDNDWITNDMITNVYVEFMNKTRQCKSMSYCKTWTGLAFSGWIQCWTLTEYIVGIILSLDNTFKSAGKAVVIDKNWTRRKLMKGGILSVINELNEIVAWVTTSYHLIILILPGVIPI